MHANEERVDLNQARVGATHGGQLPRALRAHGAPPKLVQPLCVWPCVLQAMAVVQEALAAQRAEEAKLGEAAALERARGLQLTYLVDVARREKEEEIAERRRKERQAQIEVRSQRHTCLL